MIGRAFHDLLKSRRALCIGAVLVLLLHAGPATATVVVSQVYGGGGNSGATFRNDFMELFNRGASPVDITGWSVQYASATGSSWQKTSLLGIIPPGGYYLVQQAQGAGGTVNLPTPDAIGTIAMSATNGKVALMNNDVLISGIPCPSGASVVDLVGYGVTTCFEGSGPTPALSNLNAAIRNGLGCTDTNDNLADFTVGPPTPRNSASPTSPCTGPTNPTGSGLASPGSAPPGGTTLLTVAVTPGGSPPSTGLTVTTNLVPIGGSATQPFFDDGTNGDVVAGDNTFSYATTVAFGTPLGPLTLTATIRDDQLRMGAASIALTVEGPMFAIHDIQGNGSASPHVGEFVTTTGIVTGTKTNGFFIQTPDALADADPGTSEGIFVFTSSSPPPAAASGNNVTVSGTVAEFVPGADPASPPLTEFSMSPSVTLVEIGNPLPLPIELTESDTKPSGSIEQLEKFEGMRVRVASLTVIAPTDGSVAEPTATSTTNGVFYGVITGLSRPFREPGIEVPDPLPSGSPCCVPRFDANPERLRVDSDGLIGASALEVTSGAVVTDLVGPLDYAFRTYTVLPDPGPPPVSGNVGATPVPIPGAEEFTVGSFNLERFFDDVNDPAIGEPVLTTLAYANRLNKASLAVRDVMRTPDILGVQEAENLQTLQTLANKINADAVLGGNPDPGYAAYLVEGNDIGGIDVGFLVKASRVQAGGVTQFGKTATFINPLTGLPELLNDRPPLLLSATVLGPAGVQVPITVIVNHLRSLIDVDHPTNGPRVRAKRAAQAEFLAQLIQTRQAADPQEAIVSVGDYNAFQFNDGYVDSIGTIKGMPTPATQVVVASSDLVNPDLSNLTDLVAASQRYSYVFDGNAQVLDHILATSNVLQRFTRTAYARNGADFPETYRNDTTRPERISDHDMPVAYFDFLPGAGYFTVTPCRFADTRGNGFTGPSGPPALVANAIRTFPVANQCGVPSSAKAVALNVTVSGATAAGHLTLSSSDSPAPAVSTINYRPGQTRANNAIVSLGTDGRLAAQCIQASGAVDFILDVAGYFE